MATSFQAHAHHAFENHPIPLYDGKWTPDAFEDKENAVFHPAVHRRPSGEPKGEGSSILADLVNSLAHPIGDEVVRWKITATDYETLVEWIGAERMRKLPPVGSSYDKALIWARLFVERLNSFDSAIQQFAGDSHMATQLAYVHCARLLELGEENSSALLDLFMFFYRFSTDLEHLLDRAELFSVSQGVKDQLILALADLVTVVVGVATYFHKSAGRLTPGSTSVEVYSTFAGPIESLRSRCELAAELLWKHQLLVEGLSDKKVDGIRVIKDWLQPEDPALANVIGVTAQFAQEREESTCLWLEPHLGRFLRSQQQSLSIIGHPGSGKSILATVINDFLQQPIGGVGYQPIFVPINRRIPATTTHWAVAKCILSQLFAARIGNVRLYQTLLDAYDICKKTVDIDAYENILFKALGDALQSNLKNARPLVLVVDGLDEAVSGQATLLNQLKGTTRNVSNLKLIVLASDKQAAAVTDTAVHITPELTLEDVDAVTRRVFTQDQAFNQIPEAQRETVVTRIAKAANGSLLWAKLAAKEARDEAAHNHQPLTKVVDKLIKSKCSITDLVSHRLQSKIPEEGKKILSWLVIIARPLTVHELSDLLSVQLDKGTIGEKEKNPLRFLKDAASLVFCHNEMVYLRHGQIRDAVADNLAKSSSTVISHADLAQRLLLYIKRNVTGASEPSLTPLGTQASLDLLARHRLLGFALRYWVSHVQKAFGCTTDKEVATAGKEIGPVLPECPTALILEMATWTNKPTPLLVQSYNTQTHLYEQVLPATHPATLQALLCQALFHKQFSLQDTAFSATVQVFYHAATTCQQVLSTQHVITMQMAQNFLGITANQSQSSITEVTGWREKVLKLVIECYKYHYGSTSEMVVSGMTQLLQHYESLHELQQAQGIKDWLEVNRLPDKRPLDESLVIEVHGHHQTIEGGSPLELTLFEHDASISQSFDFEALLNEAQTNVTNGNLTQAEHIFVDLWQATSTEWHFHHSNEWFLKSIRVVLGYCSFLVYQREDITNATSVFLSFWKEHKQTMSSSEAVVSQLVEAASLMESVGVSWLALSVFNYCAQHTNSQSALHKEIQQHIQSVYQEILETGGTIGKEDTTIEWILEETVLQSSTTHQLSIAATNKLIQVYWQQHRWRHATKALKKVLKVVWPGLFTLSVFDVVLPAENVDHCISLTQRLVYCYRYRHRLAKEENICLRLYYALRNEREVGDQLLGQVTGDLIQLYEHTAHTDKLVSILQTVLSDYSQRFGTEHWMVLKTLWRLAELTRPRPSCIEYYRQIFQILNKDSDLCNPDAFDPLVILSTELVHQGYYSDALQYCETLFNCLLHTEINPQLQQQAFVEAVYERYVYCLRMTQAGIVAIHDVTAQYHQACTATFGANASVTIQATQTLAFICRESKEFEVEAILLLQGLLNTHSDQVQIDYGEIQAALDAIYEEQYALGHVSHESKEQIKQLISIRRERIRRWSKEEFVYASSLSQIQELVSLYIKQEQTHEAVSLLEEATVQILSSEASAGQLVDAAQAIASSYIALGHVEYANNLSEEIYRQVVVGEIKNMKLIKLDLTSRRSRILVFLAQLEYSLREQGGLSTTVDEIHASLTAEYLYFEQFTAAMSSTSSTMQSVLSTVCRLHTILSSRNRWSTISSYLEDRFTDFFVSREGKKLKINSSESKVFIGALLAHFSTHSSDDFFRSAAIASYDRLNQLLLSKDYKSACDLALTSFKYIWAQHGFQDPLVIVKVLFQIGLAISGQDIHPRPERAVKERMLDVSATIVKALLGYCSRKDIDLNKVDAANMNKLIGIFEEKKDYHTLASILTLLWESRQRYGPSSQEHDYTLPLGRRLVITRYLIGEYVSAIRLAEDLMYNCARVHGPRHPSTVEMTVLLSQMYTSVAQGYQESHDSRELAYRYYKKAAALHEDALRVLMDPTSTPLWTRSPGVEGEETASYVRKHMHLLKLAVERLGGWPKDYSEYERLNSELFKTFGNDLKGTESMEKWKINNFGNGRAEANDDLISPNWKKMGLDKRRVIPV
ncbi:hypothetical protein N7524_001728 [Penicillium chrysogenum]|nr:hypothetical protein N7524_001728 [Penicillium chrysogenum]